MSVREMVAVALVVAVLVIAMVLAVVDSVAAYADYVDTGDEQTACDTALDYADELIELYGYEHQHLVSNVNAGGDADAVQSQDDLADAISAYYAVADECSAIR